MLCGGTFCAGLDGLYTEEIYIPNSRLNIDFVRLIQCKHRNLCKLTTRAPKACIITLEQLHNGFRQGFQKS